MTKTRLRGEQRRFGVIAVILIVIWSNIPERCFSVTPVLPMTPGDILVSYWEQNGHYTIEEFSPAGAAIKEITAPFTSQFNDPAGIAIDNQGHININHDDHTSGKSYVSNLDPATGVWQTFNIGRTTSNGFNYDLSVYQNYLFRRDGRVNLDDFSFLATDYGFPHDPFQAGASEASIGLDGKLYAVRGVVTPRNSIQVLDPITLQTIVGTRTVPGFPNIEGISANANGDIFMAILGVGVEKFDSNLNLVKTLSITNLDSPSNFSPSSLSLYSNGEILIGDRFGKVVVTDTSLNSFTAFSAVTISGNLPESTTYAVIIPVPEPSTITLLAIGAVGLLIGHRIRHKPIQ